MPGGEILLVLVVIVGVIIAIVIGAQMEKKRRQALAALASELGFSFDPSRDSSHDEQYAHFEVFRRGHSRVAMNTMWGEIEVDGRQCPVKMGDFRYKKTQSSGKSTRTVTYRFSYIIWHTPFDRVPDVLIRRESVMDKLAGAFGFDDIDFESSEFSRKFCVKSSDKRFAYDLISPQMMEFLLASNPPTVDMEHGRICVVDGTRRWQPAEFRARLAWLREFMDRWPDHLTHQLEASA
ncbi:MAG: DUF3137 domain-containing protein [Phycisphaerales bacterium JB039]